MQASSFGNYIADEAFKNNFVQQSISKSNVSPNDLSNLLNRVNGAKATNIRDIIIINTGRK